MTTVELLRDMRSRIESGWTQGASARNRQGNPVTSCSPEASQWCLVGSSSAMVATPYRERVVAYQCISDALANRNEPRTIERFNDYEGRKKEEVIQLLDESIALAESGGYG